MALPSLSRLSLEQHAAVAPVGAPVGGVYGDACGADGHKGNGGCVRIRPHPEVFELVRASLPEEINENTTSLVINFPDARARGVSPEHTLYGTRQWKTLRNEFFRNTIGSRENPVLVILGHFGSNGWEDMPPTWTWEDLVPKQNARPGSSGGPVTPESLYVQGRYVELCMKPDWALETAHVEHTKAFLTALYNYNVKHPPSWVLEEERRRARIAEKVLGEERTAKRMRTEEAKALIEDIRKIVHAIEDEMPESHTRPGDSPHSPVAELEELTEHDLLMFKNHGVFGPKE